MPNVLARVDSYETLREVSKGLGPDLVIQTPFGDSGHTTFFISDEDDWREYAGEIAKEPEVKVMIGSVSVHPVVARTTLDNVVAFDGIVQGAPRPGEAPFATLWSVRRMGRSGGGPRQ